MSPIQKLQTKHQYDADDDEQAGEVDDPREAPFRSIVFG